VLEYIFIGCAAVVGLLVGGAVSRAMSRKLIAEARARADRLTRDAQQETALVRQRGETQAREEALRLRKESESLVKQAAEQNNLLEERVRKLESRQEKREAEIAERRAEQEGLDEEIRQRKAETRSVRQEAKAKRRAYGEGIEERAEETADQIKERLADALVEESRAQCADRLRNLESTESEELNRQAKRVMGIAMGRYSGHFLSERLTSTLALPEGGAEKLSVHLSVIEEQTGVHLVLSDSGDSARIEGGSGTGRELARRAVTRFASEKKKIREPERLLKSIGTELDREIIEKGKRAFSILGLKPAHQEITSLLGKLNFRTSYAQNQWEHAVEASFLAGMMSAEAGLDVRLARRATLLHDIGKALTHEREGSHAVIGAEYARKYDEDEVVANAIGSHHGDEPAESPYAYLVAAADAMSGARPGARREMMETYVERIADLERIATSFPGVVMVHAVQAGRELRVHVDEKQVNDGRAADLSEEIAERISKDLTFPGQIRVTVIREFKAVEMAS
jgi:ribonuclease Y